MYSIHHDVYIMNNIIPHAKSTQCELCLFQIGEIKYILKPADCENIQHWLIKDL